MENRISDGYKPVETYFSQNLNCAQRVDFEALVGGYWSMDSLLYWSLVSWSYRRGLRVA